MYTVLIYMYMWYRVQGIDKNVAFEFNAHLE